MKTFKMMALAAMVMMSTATFASTSANYKKSSKKDVCIECNKDAFMMDRHHMRGEVMRCDCMGQIRRHEHKDKCKCDCHPNIKLCKKHKKMAKHDRPQVLPEYDHPVGQSRQGHSHK